MTWVSLAESSSSSGVSESNDGPYCECTVMVNCSDTEEVEYCLCVKDRQIWLQSAWSTEKAWGGSDLSDGRQYLREMDFIGQYAFCSTMVQE